MRKYRYNVDIIQKKAAVAIIFTKQNWPRNMTKDKRDKEGKLIYRKGFIHKEVTILNLFVPKSIGSRHIKQNFIRFKREIDTESRIIV